MNTNSVDGEIPTDNKEEVGDIFVEDRVGVKGGDETLKEKDNEGQTLLRDDSEIHTVLLDDEQEEAEKPKQLEKIHDQPKIHNIPSANSREPQGVVEEACIHVAGLPSNISEETVKNQFSSFGNVMKVHLIREKATGRTRGYGFVYFSSMDEVFRLLDRGESILIADEMTGESNVSRSISMEVADPKNQLYMSRLPRSKNDVELMDYFNGKLPHDAQIVKFSSCKNSVGESRGFGWATFPTHQHAMAALRVLRDLHVEGKPLVVEIAEAKAVDPRLLKDIRTLFVKPISSSLSDEEVADICGGSSIIERMDFLPLGDSGRYDRSRSRQDRYRVAFVTFKTKADAEKMLKTLDGKVVGDMVLYSGWRLPEGMRRQESHQQRGSRSPPRSRRGRESRYSSRYSETRESSRDYDRDRGRDFDRYRREEPPRNDGTRNDPEESPYAMPHMRVGPLYNYHDQMANMQQVSGGNMYGYSGQVQPPNSRYGMY